MPRSAQRIRTIKISDDTLPRAHTCTVRTDLSILIIPEMEYRIYQLKSLLWTKKRVKLWLNSQIYDRLSIRIRHISCDTHSWATVHTQRRVRRWNMVWHEGYQHRNGESQGAERLIDICTKWFVLDFATPVRGVRSVETHRKNDFRMMN